MEESNGLLYNAFQPDIARQIKMLQELHEENRKYCLSLEQEAEKYFKKINAKKRIRRLQQKGRSVDYIYKKIHKKLRRVLKEESPENDWDDYQALRLHFDDIVSKELKAMDIGNNYIGSMLFFNREMLQW